MTKINNNQYIVNLQLGEKQYIVSSSICCKNN